MAVLIRQRWTGRRAPQWPFRLNTRSPQAQGLILFCPPVPLGAAPSIQVPDLSPRGYHGARLPAASVAMARHPFGGDAFQVTSAVAGTAVRWSQSELVNLPTTHNFTMSAWCYRPALATTTYPFAAWNGTDDIVLYSHDQELGAVAGRVFWRDVGAQNIILTTTLFDVSLPHVFTFAAYSLTDRRFFIDGQQAGATSTADGSGAGPFSTFEWLGYEGGASQKFLDGQSWWLRVWNRALSPQEIAAYDGDPRQWWDLAEPRATTVTMPAAATTFGALAPDAILASTNLTGAVTDIQDDPDASPATGWLTATDPLAATDVRVTFPTPGAA